MSKNKQKLELTWIGKDREVNLEPRILVEVPEKSYGDKDTENMLIHGDNLLALKALEQDYTGKIKCIYIDPPYNTGSAFEHYDDNVEHSKWLSLMKSRLEILHNLLAEDGSIWINLDDNEAHYCKILCDEIFGRNNFLSDVIWEKADSPKMDAKIFSSRSDHILVFSKCIDKFTINRISLNSPPEHYNKIDSNGKVYYLKPLRAMGADGFREKRPALYFPIIAPDGTEVFPKNQDGSDSRWRWSREKVNNELDRLEYIKGKNGWSIYFRIYFEDSDGVPPETIWKHEDVGSNRTSKNENKYLFGSAIFDTPKPERLIERVLTIGSNEGDLVLDSFLGSGTTAAVAHKMGRKWIGIELGDHCYTHCEPRLQKVIDGTDQGGISKAVNWQGGGGYKFYELAPSLLKKDEFNNWIIEPKYDAEMLAEAMAKHEGYKFSPDETNVYKQGKSTEKDFIFTTTQFISLDLLNKIATQINEDESLLICATHFEEGIYNKFSNITIKKIPQILLDRCEFGKLEYNLNIIEEAQPEDFDDEEILEDEE